MRLSGGGRELKVPGKNVKVNIALSLERKDLSGQTSDSSFVNAGAKAQKVNVSSQIPLSDAAALMQLAEIARACNKNNEPIVYSVSDNLCNAMSIRQVIFSGELRVTESDSLRAYDVSFELQEYQTVSEKREERANANAAVAEPAKDGEVNIGTNNPQKVNQIVKDTAQ